MGRVAVAASALIVGTALVVGPTPAAAFLEFLFGARPAPQPVIPQAAPLDIRVSPKRKSHPRPHHGKRDRESHKAAASHATPTTNRQIPMNPRTNPDWYLKDPNIRFGDIVILESGPVVYQGSGKVRTREDFVSLRQSRLSAAGMRDIRMMAAGIWTPTDMPPPETAPSGSDKRAAAR